MILSRCHRATDPSIGTEVFVKAGLTNAPHNSLRSCRADIAVCSRSFGATPYFLQERTELSAHHGAQCGESNDGRDAHLGNKRCLIDDARALRAEGHDLVA